MNESTSLMGGSGIWIFGLILLFMIFGGNNGLFGNNAAAALGYENLATENSVQRGFDNQNSMANQREILSAVNAGAVSTTAAVNQTFHDSLAATQNLYNELQRDVAANAVTLANLAGSQQKCCCDTQMLIQQTSAATDANIAQNRYDAAMNTAAINANTTAQTQKILDAIAQNKIEALQAQVNQLQLAQATNGMLRFPNSWSYGAGPFPPIFGGCGCGAA